VECQLVFYSTFSLCNLLWTIEQLKEYVLDWKNASSKLKKVVATLLPLVAIKAKSEAKEDHFDPKGIAILLGIIAKLADKLKLNIADLKDLVGMLLLIF
jgi:hypothetical protein